MEHHPSVAAVIERHPQSVDVLLATLANAALTPAEQMLLSIVARQQQQLDTLVSHAASQG